MNQKFPTGHQKDLYVLKFQDSETRDVAPLSGEEELQGWFQTENWSGEPILLNERHQAGSVRSRVGPHLLAWEVNPGEQVVARLTVTFNGYLHISESGADTVIDTACCQPIAYSPTLRETNFLVRLTSVLGRATSLGEDGTEDDFSNDALSDHLMAALEGDWRRILCQCELIPSPNDDAGYEQWSSQAREKKVSVKLEESNA